MTEQRLYYIDRETEEIRSTEYYRDRATSSAFFNSEDAALTELLKRLTGRMNRDTARFMDAIARKAELEK